MALIGTVSSLAIREVPTANGVETGLESSMLAQVLSRMRASYSSCIALTHLGSWRARATVQSSVTDGVMVVRPYFGLGLMMVFLEWVCIEMMV